MATNETTWQITSQATNQVSQNQAGNVITGVIVYYITGDGNEGSVFVPDATYNVKNVTSLVRESAVILDQVGRLSGTETYAG